LPSLRASRGPQQASYADSDVAPNRVSDVLVPRGHHRARPPHDAHHRSLRHAEHQELGAAQRPAEWNGYRSIGSTTYRWTAANASGSAGHLLTKERGSTQWTSDQRKGESSGYARRRTLQRPLDVASRCRPDGSRPSCPGPEGPS
jgi:hypothetical protein